jgi:DnaK suppressor protein
MAPSNVPAADRERRLERMLSAKREEILRAVSREVGGRMAEDVLAELGDRIEIGDRSVTAHGQDLELMRLERRRAEVREIDAALARLRAGTYGRCQECGAEIEEARLEILPFANRCVECKRLAEADEQRGEGAGQGYRAGFEDVRDVSSDSVDDED